MQKTSFIIFVFLVLLWPAFVGGQTASTAKVEIINGVECIHNPGVPLHPEMTLTFVEDLSINAEDKDGNIVFIEPWLLIVDNEENIYISERKDQFIRVFNSNGKQIKKIGAKGSGPGEFQAIDLSIAVTKNGMIVVQDSRSRRTSFFDSSGRFIKSFQWRTKKGEILLVKEKSFVMSVMENGGDAIGQYTYFIVKEVDFDGNEREIDGEFAISRYAPMRLGGLSVYFSEPVVRASEFAGDQDGGGFIIV